MLLQKFPTFRSGWEICIDGPEKGRDHRIGSVKNYIGRDASMDKSAVTILANKENWDSCAHSPILSLKFRIPIINNTAVVAIKLTAIKELRKV